MSLQPSPLAHVSKVKASFESRGSARSPLEAPLRQEPELSFT